MNDRVFLDTNILVYSYSNDEPDKQVIAQGIISNNNSFISTQVLTELSNTLTRKFKFEYEPTQIVIKECCTNSGLHINIVSTIIKACEIAKKFNYSFYDSLIIAAAIESNCTILYTEDMSNGLIIDNVLTIKNPF